MISTYQKIKAAGIRGTIDALLRRISPPRLPHYPIHRNQLAGKYGMEIGGPSGVFGARGLFPIYPVASKIDNCTFSHRTVWEGEIEEGEFHFDTHKPPGKQFIMEARDLSRIADASYDFLASSHVLEHVANPLLALSEWIRVLRTEGLLILILPHRDNTFDHARPVTSLEHLIEDFERQTPEADMTHLDEILRLHDLRRDPGAADHQTFKTRSMNNFENRCFHHHVFDTRLAVKLVDHMALQILSVELARPYHIVIVARKPLQGAAVDNKNFLGVDGEPCWKSPFPSDKNISAISDPAALC
jgi:SAM-dependent methyltransferase